MDIEEEKIEPKELVPEEEDEDSFVFKIKNLDTGEEEEIKNEEDEEKFNTRISFGLNSKHLFIFRN